MLALLLGGCGTGAPVAPTATVIPAPLPVATSTAFAFPAFPTTGPTAPAPTLTATPAPAPSAIPTTIPTTAPRATPKPTIAPTAVSITTATAVSEGVRVTGADRWQAAGITGKGVKVGIIDSSFTDYRRFLGAARVTVRSFRKDGLIEDARDPDGNHGTACAEIVHEMAPDADLYLGVENGASTFIAAVQWMTDMGVSIISYSNGWDGEYPQDDTSRMSQAVDTAKAAGVFFVVAAGNSGSGKIGSQSYQGHYGATFTDADGDGFHDFVPPEGGAIANGVAVRIAKGDTLFVTLEWDDWAAPHVTYALSLSDASGKEVAREDTPVSRSNPDPFQTLTGDFPAGAYTLRVSKQHPTDPNLAFGIFFDGAQFGQITPKGSITVPADAKGAVAVGEADWQDDTVFLSSALGPTRDGRPKPELVAPACVSNAAIAAADNDDFCGTSAAAPHVAGAAALYKQAFPNATPDAILAYLQQQADKSVGAGLDPAIVGAGRLALGPPPVRP